MGRKIPARKHRTIKHPEKQRAKRLAEIANKINAPPKDLEHQDVPKSLERVIKLKNAVKEGKIGLKKKKKKKSSAQRLIQLGAEQVKSKRINDKSKPEKVVPVFNQLPGENQWRFWNRVNAETTAFIKEAEYETKFNVRVQRDPQTGEVVGMTKAPKDEIEELRKKHSNIKKKKKKPLPEGEEPPPRLTKAQKRKEKLVAKKQKKIENSRDEFKEYEEKVQDKVKFGETVHAPPQLKPPKKVVKSDPNRVKTSSLLLTSMLDPSKSSSKENQESKSVNKTVKLKHLPFGERRQFEKQQSEIIAAYKLLKAKRHGQSTVST